jgi:serine/threonine protein kinase
LPPREGLVLEYLPLTLYQVVDRTWPLELPFPTGFADAALEHNQYFDKVMRWMMRSLMAALRTLHTRGWTHNDVKPANCCVRVLPRGEAVHLRDLTLVLLDFGLANSDLIQHPGNGTRFFRAVDFFGTDIVPQHEHRFHDNFAAGQSFVSLWLHFAGVDKALVDKLKRRTEPRCTSPSLKRRRGNTLERALRQEVGAYYRMGKHPQSICGHWLRYWGRLHKATACPGGDFHTKICQRLRQSVSLSLLAALDEMCKA